MLMQTWRRCRNITKVLFAYIEVVLTFKLKGGYNQNQSDRSDFSVVLTFNLKGLYNICAAKP